MPKLGLHDDISEPLKSRLKALDVMLLLVAEKANIEAGGI
jgi:hypothetical protein